MTEKIPASPTAKLDLASLDKEFEHSTKCAVYLLRAMSRPEIPLDLQKELILRATKVLHTSFLLALFGYITNAGELLSSKDNIEHLQEVARQTALNFWKATETIDQEKRELAASAEALFTILKQKGVNLDG